MRAPAAGADRDLPLLRRLAAHRFTKAQLVAIDVVTVALIAITFGFLIPHRAPRASGTAWDAGGWVTYAVAAVATPFRRRFPRATLRSSSPSRWRPCTCGQEEGLSSMSSWPCTPSPPSPPAGPR